MKFSALAKSSIFISLLFSFFLFTPSVFAKDSAIILPPSTNVETDVPDNLHNWTQIVTLEVLSSLSCQLTGIDPINPSKPCLGVKPAAGKIGYLPSPQTGGLVSFLGDMIAATNVIPVHTSDYFHYLSKNFGIVKNSYAQTTGSGFEGLRPFVTIWSVFRNIVYLLLVIIFVIIGLAIMLRVKIDPRTVMTIQNQIPKIIIGILAVTFSFAISGFLIDLMWTFTFFVYNMISLAVNDPVINPRVIQNSTPWGTIGSGNLFSLTAIASVDVEQFINQMLHFGQTGIMKALIDLLTSTLICGPLGFVGVAACFVGTLFNHGPVGILAGMIAWIIFAIAITVALFRLWFALIKAYIEIIFGVILGPFWIIAGIIPGSHLGFGSWIKGLAANLLAYPATIAMLMFAIVIRNLIRNATGTPFVPPLIGASGDTDLIGSLAAIGILLMTPNIVSMIKKAVKAAGIETGIGKALAPGLAAPGRIAGGAAALTFGTTYEHGFLDKGGKRSALGIKGRQLGILPK